MSSGSPVVTNVYSFQEPKLDSRWHDIPRLSVIFHKHAIKHAVTIIIASRELLQSVKTVFIVVITVHLHSIFIFKSCPEVYSEPSQTSKMELLAKDSAF